MECSELTERVVDRLTGQAGEAALRELEDHLAACVACRGESLLCERAWSGLEEDSEATLTPEFRRRTLGLLEDEMLRARIREFKPRRNWPRFAAEAAAVLLAIAGGFLLARRGAMPAPSEASMAAASTSPEGILRDNPRLANVSYRAGSDGKLEVGFDVTARRTVAGRPDDPNMAKLLAYLLTRNAETAGEKSRAIDLVSQQYRPGTQASPDIVAALTATLRKDPNPGVRKKAADTLAGFSSTPEIRAAFLEALRSDRNPSVRLTAIDALAASAAGAADPTTIESLRERAQDPAENGFVRAKAASALRNF
jgi:HEAT repeat protein